MVKQRQNNHLGIDKYDNSAGNHGMRIIEKFKKFHTRKGD